MKNPSNEIPTGIFYWNLFWFLTHPLTTVRDAWEWLVAPMASKPGHSKILSAITMLASGSFSAVIAQSIPSMDEQYMFVAALIAAILWWAMTHVGIIGDMDEKFSPVDKYILSVVWGPFWFLVLVVTTFLGGL